MFIRPTRRGWRFDGHTAAVADGGPWTVRYTVAVDRHWRTRTAHVWTWTAAGNRHDMLVADGAGRWDVNGEHAPHLDGCLDVDLESSACTNTLPVHRLASVATGVHEAPAAYVSVLDPAVERLDQTYELYGDGDRGPLYDYTALRFEFACRLEYDRSGLVVNYPGIATRR